MVDITRYSYEVYIDGPPCLDGGELEEPVGRYGPWGSVSRATYVTRRKEGDDPVHFNDFRERIQGGQRRRESGAVGRAGREDKCDTRHTLRRGSEDGEEPRSVADRAVIQLRGETDETIVRGSGDVTAWGRVQ